VGVGSINKTQRERSAENDQKQRMTRPWWRDQQQINLATTNKTS
jgi:hypothetical protein